MADRRSTREGPGRLLVAVYAVFAISATARAGYQVATELDQAPVAYLLSALAAVVYLVATVSLARSTTTSRRIAWGAVLTELVGLLAVSVLGVAVPRYFPHESVWSGFGRGYGYVPLVLPLLGIAWLWWTGRRSAIGGEDEKGTP